MKDLALVLTGKDLIVSLEGEVLSLSTDDGWTLVIYNEFAFLPASEEFATPWALGLRVVVNAIAWPSQCLELGFEGGSRLRVDLSPNGYNGPEAMQLAGPDGEIIIWN